MAKRREKRSVERARPRRERTRAASTDGRDPGLKIEPLHVALVVGGVLVAVVGYWFLDRGSISTAPLLLVLAYLILVPVGLSLPVRRRSDKSGSERT